MSERLTYFAGGVLTLLLWIAAMALIVYLLGLLEG